MLIKQPCKTSTLNRQLPVASIVEPGKRQMPVNRHLTDLKLLCMPLTAKYICS